MFKTTNIYTLRKTLQKSQLEFSELVGISLSAVCDYEHRRRIPSGNSLKKIAVLLSKIKPPINITIEQILGDY